MLELFGDYNKGSISDLVEETLKNPVKRYKVIYIDIWFDKYTIKSNFNGIEECKHLVVDDNLRCSCGAWVGNIAEESEPWEYYQHIFNLVNTLKAQEIYIRSPIYYPPTYKYHIFDTEVKLNFPFAETYHIYDKVVDFHNRDVNQKQKSFYLSHFTKRKSKLWKNTVVRYKGFNPLYLLEEDSLWVNPYYTDIKQNIDISFHICNTEVLKTLKK